MSASRANEANVSKVRAFIDFQEQFQKEHRLTADNVVNVDETRVLLSQLKKGSAVLANRLAKEATWKGERTKAFCSYIPFAAANGDIVVQFFVLPTSEGATAALVRKKNSKDIPTYYLL